MRIVKSRVRRVEPIKRILKKRPRKFRPGEKRAAGRKGSREKGKGKLVDVYG